MNIRFILNEPRNPQNIGVAARGMANFGFKTLAVVAPYRVAWKEIRSAVHAGPVVKKALKYKTLKAATAPCHLVIGTSAGSRRGTEAQWISLDDARVKIEAANKKKQKVALVFGSEKSGLSNDDLTYCHYLIRIPTVPDCPSMNLGQAVTIVAYALRTSRQVLPVTPLAAPLVNVETLERLISQGLKAVDKAGLLKGWTLERSEQRLRKSFLRWNMNDIDVAMMHALFRWILKSSQKGEPHAPVAQ